ncbi:RES domain-containing protein [Owenweeksia hongkongensis]|uniref:RES domain-containing protein n=1 Tax=Owenweeksia hongkongensis TaxID=253245 RepID=UPI003A95836D
MNVCYHCIADRELSAFIESNGISGRCDVCLEDKPATINLEELMSFFQELLENFEPASLGEDIQSLIGESWNLFASREAGEVIMEKVFASLESSKFNQFDKVDFTEEIRLNISYWDKLKEDIKWKKRFFPDLNTIEDLGWDGFFNTQYELGRDTTLYRARVHHESGMTTYAADEMMCPPAAASKGGRANPLGIPFLYLSDNPLTVLYEVRSSFLDEISVGEFRLKEEYDPVKIVDFTEQSSLFSPSQINQVIKATLLRKKISMDLSKPMRRYDSEIEYIPTQFICEYVNVFTGARGIRFASSLHPSGNNVVIFDQALMECTKVTSRKINKLDLDSEPL